MSVSPLIRLGAAGGIAYGVMEVVGDSLSSTTDSTDTPQRVAAYFTANAPTAATWFGIYLETLGAFAFLLFGVYVWSLGREHPNGRFLSVLALSGSIIQAAVILDGEPPKIAAYFRAAQGLEPHVAAALLDLNNAAFYIGFMPQALLVAATAALAIRASLLPRWLAGMGFAVAVALVAVIAMAPGSGLPILVNLVFFVWLAVTSGVLLWHPPLEARPLSKLSATV